MIRSIRTAGNHHAVRKEVSKRETDGVEIEGEIEKKVQNSGFKSSEKKGVQFSNCTFYVGNDFKGWIYFDVVLLFDESLSGFWLSEWNIVNYDIMDSIARRNFSICQ